MLPSYRDSASALRHFVELEDGVPVAAGGGDAGGAIERPAAEFGLARAVGEVEVDVVAGEVVAVAAGGVFFGDGPEGGAGGCRRLSGEEADVDQGAVGGGFFCKRVGGDEAGQLVVGADDHFH